MDDCVILVLLSIMTTIGGVAGWFIGEVNGEQYMNSLQEQKCRVAYTQLVDYEKCKNMEFTKFWEQIEVKQ